MSYILFRKYSFSDDKIIDISVYKTYGWLKNTNYKAVVYYESKSVLMGNDQEPS